ncbi:hypothetical protein ACFY7C_17265 [Streptomyces sp. NPDC012769]|uniref:hypothetical protein n=1 Tax=Streptomyces sp. NPDC012769 TaxID=3364848 RepID=UPI0036815CA8
MGEGRVGAAVMVFPLGALGFAIVPGLQARVLGAAAHTHLGARRELLRVPARGGVRLLARRPGHREPGLGPRGIYPVAAALTVLGILASLLAWRQDRRTATAKSVPAAAAAAESGADAAPDAAPGAAPRATEAPAP